MQGNHKQSQAQLKVGQNSTGHSLQAGARIVYEGNVAKEELLQGLPGNCRESFSGRERRRYGKDNLQSSRDDKPVAGIYMVSDKYKGSLI